MTFVHAATKDQKRTMIRVAFQSCRHNRPGMVEGQVAFLLSVTIDQERKQFRVAFLFVANLDQERTMIRVSVTFFLSPR